MILAVQNITRRYVLPSTVEVNHRLPTLADHLKAYIKSTDQPIIMYLHGQDGTRATHYRANHYRMMTNFGNHIIALDYRGYGDSTGIPSVYGVIHDVLHVYKVIRQVCPDNPITIWGHSMGTGVASWTMYYLFKNQTDYKRPSGLVLEAPFYNTMQAFVSYPVTRILRINPYFMQAALDSFTTVKLDFPNNEIISLLPLPIVVIHAEDDVIIPYFHLELIQDYVKEHRDHNLPPIRFITVPRSARCGHNHIYSYPKFEEIVRFDYLSNVNCVCILINADDDLVVPYILSKQLLQTGMHARTRHILNKELFPFNIDMISYYRIGYGHKLIY
ncbi:unnamed protein product [Rotaria sp. Silwood1]|nr:unnamed protein product [Rotaria sp. Silwood1]